MNENRALTKEEELRLLTAVREFGKPLMFIVVVALYTGCRKGELMGLKWRHIDFENRAIKIDSQLVRQYTPFIEGETKTVYVPKSPKTKKLKASHSYDRAFGTRIYRVQKESPTVESGTRLRSLRRRLCVSKPQQHRTGRCHLLPNVPQAP